jgi:hypothetical protein
VHPNSRFKTLQIFQCLASERYDVIRIKPFVSTQLVTSKWVMDDNDALKVTFFFLTSFLVCHASFSLHYLHRQISIGVGDGYRPLVVVGHGYGGLVLQQALVELHRYSHVYEDLLSNLCGIVFYGGTNTKLTNKHGPLLMENKGWSLKNLTSWMFKTVKDRLMEDTLSELSEQFGAALDLKKVKVCVIDKNKSILQVCILYPYSNSSL